MKIKKITLTIGFSLALVSCSAITGSNIDTRETNLVLDDYEKYKKIKDNILSTDNENISSILENNNKEYGKTTNDTKIDVEDWKNKIVSIGEFNQDFVDSLAKERIKDLVTEAREISQTTGYWDVKDFVFQKLAKDFPGESNKFPLDSIENIYEWKISDDDQGVDKYQTERKFLEEKGLDSAKAYEIPNKDLKAAFKKAYEENENGLYDDYISAVYKILSSDSEETTQSENNTNQDSSNLAYENQQDYDKLRKVMVDYYEFNPDVVENITNEDIDIASERAQKRLEETGYGDIGLIFDELGKMYPGSSSMYPGN
ncbi:MAG: hypothetical protein ACTIH2_00945 [Anaerococcus sp.]